ncbi:hypothetical protein ACFYW8_42160 [Streptomyces sp. NPDC002742]|uniref:hypothetical protein n=1 Tax=Streptomyces sp. NPDC002742 TaxID=3364663 RepID=UPI0036B77DE4
MVLQDAGTVIDPRTAQIERLKTEVAELKDRISERDASLAELKAFRTRAVSQLAAQHVEIARLREQAAQDGNVRRLPTSSRSPSLLCCRPPSARGPQLPDHPSATEARRRRAHTR